MSEKRFTETLSTGIVTDNLTNKEYLCEYRIDDEFLELINSIAESQSSLARESRNSKKRMQELIKENEELKKKIKIMGDAFTKFEEVFYLKVYEPSKHYDEKFLCSLSNAILGDDDNE